MLNFRHYARRFVQQPPSYVFGRFRLFRASFAQAVRLRQRLGGQRLPSLDGLPPSPFLQADPRRAVAALRKDALAQGILDSPYGYAYAYQREVLSRLRGGPMRYRSGFFGVRGYGLGPLDPFDRPPVIGRIRIYVMVPPSPPPIIVTAAPPMEPMLIAPRRHP